MAESATMSGKPLIESDRVEGTTVYDPQGNDIGSIKRGRERPRGDRGAVMADTVGQSS